MDAAFFKGVTFGFYARNGYFSSAAARSEADRIADTGAGWVCLVATVLQDAFYSTRQYRDFVFTPGDHELLAIVARLRGAGVKVMLRPMIECRDGSQRCHLTFPNDGEIIPGKRMHYVRDWFESYAALTRHYARLATDAGCEGYGLDSELDHLLVHNGPWRGIVAAAREEFAGHVSASFIRVEDRLAWMEATPDCWLRDLDSLGTSMYEPAADRAGATAGEMAAFLAPHVAKCRRFAEAYGKPFHFGECGCCATAGAARLPHFWNNGGGYDGDEQANYLDAVIRAFEPEPWWRGLFWWKWDEQNDRPRFRDDPRGDKGFTMAGKPAEKVFRAWCARR